MRFADIDRKEIGVVFLIVVNLHHVTDVAAEGRSSVAAKDNNERPASGAFADVKMIGTIQSKQPGVGSVVADFEISAVHMRQGIAHHAVSVLGAAGHLAEREERGQQNNQENGNRPFPKESHCRLVRPIKDSRTQNLARTKSSIFESQLKPHLIAEKRNTQLETDE
jgi:hypothetical protein